VRSRLKAALLVAAVLYAAAGLIPLGWSFGGAVLLRYRDLFELAATKSTWVALARSASLGGLSALGALALAAPLAFLTGRTAIPARGALSAAALMPLALPAYVVALGLGPWLPSSPWVAAPLVMALSLYPIPYLFLRAGLASLDPSLEEAGLLARGLWPTVRHLTWPHLVPWTAAALALVFLLGLGELGVPTLLGFRAYSGLILIRFAATYDAAGATIAALPLLLFVLALFGIEARWLRKSGVFAGRLRNPRLLDLGRARIPAAALCLSILAASPALPVVAMAVRADRVGFERALATAGRPAANGFLVAAIGVVLALVIGLVLALLTRGGARVHRGLPLLYFVLPGAVVGIGLIGFWNQPGLPPLYGSAGLLALALALRYAILVELAAEAGLRDLPSSQEEAARLAGRSELAILRRILVPQIRRPLLLGVTAFVLLALRDLDTVVTLYPPGGETLLVRLYTALANSPQGFQSSLALLQVGLALPIAAALAVLSRKSPWLL